MCSLSRSEIHLEIADAAEEAETIANPVHCFYLCGDVLAVLPIVITSTFWTTIFYALVLIFSFAPTRVANIMLIIFGDDRGRPRLRMTYELGIISITT